MGKSTHSSGQPLYCQVIKLLDKSTILLLSRKYSGEHYVKRFDTWTHLVVMLYAVIMRFDSLREIMASLQAESRKLCHWGIRLMPSRSTLSDANRRRLEIIFESIYRDLYATYRNVFFSDSRKNMGKAWMNRLQIIDSTIITLFSNLLFKGVGASSQERQKERRYQGTYRHTCQRRSSFRYKVYFCCNQRFLHVKAVSTEQRRHNCHGPRIH